MPKRIQFLIFIVVIFSFTRKGFGKKSREPSYDQPKPDPKFTALDDATKIQLEIERQTLTQTIDSLKSKLSDLERREKTSGSLDEASEDERDRIREQLDTLYRQRNDLYERIQKKIDEKSSNRKASPPDDVRRREERATRMHSEERREKYSSNPRKFPRVSDEV